MAPGVSKTGMRNIFSGLTPMTNAATNNSVHGDGDDPMKSQDDRAFRCEHVCARSSRSGCATAEAEAVPVPMDRNLHSQSLQRLLVETGTTIAQW